MEDHLKGSLQGAGGHITGATKIRKRERFAQMIFEEGHCLLNV